MTGKNMTTRKKILMLVFNNVLCDARVLKEACLLTQEYDVTVIGIKEQKTDKTEEFYEKVRIVRMGLHILGFSAVLRHIEFCMKAIFMGIAHRPDIYHAHDYFTILPACIAAKLTGARLVYDAHELTRDMVAAITFRLKIWAAIENMCLKKADKIIAANDSRAEIMWKEYGLCEKPAFLLNCCSLKQKPQKRTPPRKREILASHGIPLDGRKVVIYEGRLESERGLENLAKSLRSLPGAILLFIGAGPLSDQLIRLTREHSLTDRIFFIRKLDNKSLMELLWNVGDVGVAIYQNTCRNNYFCAPNKLFEYLISGMPVAAADLPELTKIVKGYNVGEVFDPEDPDSIAHAITTILGNNNENTIKNNIDTVINDYNWEKEGRKLFDLYESLIRQDGRSDK